MKTTLKYKDGTQIKIIEVGAYKIWEIFKYEKLQGWFGIRMGTHNRTKMEDKKYGNIKRRSRGL